MRGIGGLIFRDIAFLNIGGLVELPELIYIVLQGKDL